MYTVRVQKWGRNLFIIFENSHLTEDELISINSEMLYRVKCCVGFPFSCVCGILRLEGVDIPHSMYICLNNNIFRMNNRQT